MPRKRRAQRFNPSTDKCYVCCSPATSDEHAPPRSFFPPSYSKSRLLTVPACASHNLDNSMDVEYVRNVFAIMYGSNAAAEEVFEVAKRSWDHSDKLFNRTFHDVIEAEIGGEERTALFTVDLSRVQNIIRHI